VRLGKNLGMRLEMKYPGNEAGKEPGNEAGIFPAPV